ncbi:hypothetical protein MNEG_13875 [Monoraphidium neglectum]|uniref:Uncharacterized protein n=1 Tax=Monoraphidium neglectum TaxID=145388 RepID=A0A0D2LX54_9CHLO|nr:hypothetical protein MNEG_13875 [Monoraphidium neglectum]KIY94086.1 hypothetical protein MNEG_13875 [Monoraphidium neglectum]|eukprot:XP_013893106.1 hypothetical protein MNEG_13875 [Monoraphidium neglectum]
MQLQRPAGITRPLARATVSVHAVARPSRAASTVAPATPATPALSLPLAAFAAAAAPLLLAAEPAFATGGAFGILEGRTAALVHPAVMAILFGTTLYAGYLGLQWRRVRTIGDDIKGLKAQLPKPVEGAEAAPPSPIAEQVAVLEKERKELVAGGFKDKHNAAGNVLLAFGVAIAVEGCVNTWMRTGKLFPGPHLFAGAGIVVLWALAASLVPAMQKGNDNARSAHIALNTLNVALFAWQLPTGLDIVFKVFQFTSWP